MSNFILYKIQTNWFDTAHMMLIPVAMLSEAEALIAWTLRPWVHILLKAWMFILVYPSSFTCHPKSMLYSLVTKKVL
jgi:hypothetical protein